MKSFLRYCIILAVMGCSNHQILAQEDYTLVNITLPKEINTGGEIILTINNIRKTAVVYENTVELRFPKLFRSTTFLSIEYKRQRWQATAELSGIGEIFIELFKGGISVRESAKATFKSSGGGLDIWIDNSSYGTTEISKRVRPDRTYSIQWKEDKTTVRCDTSINLSAGSRRTFTCDPKTGKVTVEND